MTDLLERYVDTAQFTELFVQLGWDRPYNDGRTVRIDAEGGTFTLNEVATFKGVTIWSCPQLPPGRVQRDLDRQMRHESAERVLIFHEGQYQQWRWPQTRDAEGTGTRRLINHEHTVGRDNPALAQRLALIEIGLEEDVTVLDVTRRLRKAFDAEKITKKFYKEFAKRHRLLCDLIDGIEVSNDDSQPELRWYASLLLNRLMFIYFMQRKGFLDDHLDYLRSRLDQIRSLDQPAGFYEFYRDFLIPLFHDGLGTEAGVANVDDETIRQLIGDIPYVNGGIFAPHPLEIANNIRVPDHAFEDIFDFFDAWQWHLDDRPSGNPNEVNPDMLGYIFEQFVNNREEVAAGSKDAQTNADKGAYYTKEDVTGYLTANTLLPVFLERLEERTGVDPWQRLRDEADRYIWPSILHGHGQSLPDSIIAEQEYWPRPTWDDTKPSSDLALPAESWWEVADRRSYADDLRTRLRDGRIASVNDAITYNLDLETLAVDCIDGLDNPDDVAEAWDILSELRVIDPTCGSGAFLFAALGVLHDLYSATFEAAERHDRTLGTDRLDTLLSGVDSHANRDYYLLKHATLNNLYGVDIMPEAVEIARLRLFLKLIAQVEKRDDIEPLPDLEFNIRSGNALVGALDEHSIRDRVSILNHDRVDKLVEQSAEAATTYRAFAEAQDHGSDSEVRAAKAEHQRVSAELRGVLHGWWHEAEAAQQRIDTYLDVHRPFHWFLEFSDVFSQGGFDVVIGNPPYVAKAKVPYSYSGFRTDRTPDIYAPCLERSASLVKDGGRLAMIVPLSLAFSESFAAARDALRLKFGQTWSSTFGKRPSSLFSGVQVRCTVVLGGPGRPQHHATTHNLWVSERRPTLFEGLRYAELDSSLYAKKWFKVGDPALVEILRASGLEPTVRHLERAAGLERPARRHLLWWKPVATYWMPVSFDAPPTYESDGSRSLNANVKSLELESEELRDLAVVTMAGKLGYLWWSANGDDLNVPPWVVREFMAPYLKRPELARALRPLALELKERLPETMIWNKNAGKWVGNFDLSECDDITDRADQAILRAMDLSKCWVPLVTWYHRVMQSTGEATGSVRGDSPPV